MKAFFTSIFLLVLCLNNQAQSNFHKMTIGAGAGITQSFADVANHGFAIAGYGSFDYHLRKFKSGNPDIYTYFSIGFRYHFGTLGLSSKNLY